MTTIRSAIALLAFLALASGTASGTTKDQSRIGEESSADLAENNSPLPLPTAEEGNTAPSEQSIPPSEDEDLTTPDPSDSTDAGPSEDDLNLGDIPDIRSVELTVDMARRALDAWIMVREKYRDADLEAYGDLQEFVERNEQGAAFEADIKQAGFATVEDWSLAITSLGFAHNAVVDDPTAEITAQIEEIKADDTLAQDLRDRMIASLGAMIPSANNRSVVETLLSDPAYKDKVAELETESDDIE